jgi:L-2,4-diaminobutyrate decarboxylase
VKSLIIWAGGKERSMVVQEQEAIARGPRLIELTRRLDKLVREHPDFEVIGEPRSNVSCFRYVPNVIAERQGEPAIQKKLDRLNRLIVEAVQRSGAGLVMATRINGRVAIRATLSSFATLEDGTDVREEDVDAVFEIIARWGRLLSKSS